MALGALPLLRLLLVLWLATAAHGAAPAAAGAPIEGDVAQQQQAPAPGDERDGVERRLDELRALWRRKAAGEDEPGFLPLVRELAATGDPRIIPVLIGVIDADNTYETIYLVGHFGLRGITGVEYSAFHDGAWWRRWWERSRNRYPAAAAGETIPDLPRTDAGREHVPFPETLDTLDGKLRWLRRQLASGDLSDLGQTAKEIARHHEPSAIPTLIAVIDADNTYATVYGVGYFGLAPLTGVAYSPFHDGAWWRRWWGRHRAGFPPEVRAMEIETIEPTEAGRLHEPYPETLETLEGKLDYLLDRIGAGEALPLSDIVSEIGKHRDPSAIPVLVALIEADGTNDGIYTFGYAGLTPITGVPFDAAHDGAWWRAWWEANRGRFPEDVRRLEIPDLRAPYGAWKAGQAERDAAAIARQMEQELADVPARELAAGGDERMRYFLIGPQAGAAPPPGGYHLLLVLPGGTGDAEFLPFCRRIAKHALPPRYVVAELVAPHWSAEQAERLVWPTRTQRAESMAFATEDFIDAVVEDVRARHPIDESYVFALGWSSGGPPVYAAALGDGTPLTGAFVAMSVFRPEQLPPLDAARGRAFYVLHSPDDWISIETHARAAERALRQHGAAVRLQTYRGGHGWTEDPFGHVRRGVSWLEREVEEGEGTEGQRD